MKKLCIGDFSKTNFTFKDPFSLDRLDLRLVCQLQKQQNFLGLVVFQNQLQVVQVSKNVS